MSQKISAQTSHENCGGRTSRGSMGCNDRVEHQQLGDDSVNYINTTSSKEAIELSVITTQPTSSLANIEKRDNVTFTQGSAGQLLFARGAAPEPNNRIARRKRLHHFIALCVCFALEGWNDGSTGPILPRLQSTYHVRISFRLGWTTCSISVLTGQLRCRVYVMGVLLRGKCRSNHGC